MELKFSNFTSVKYHNLFDYKLTKEELVRWQYKNKKEKVSGIKNKSRLQREKYSKDKLSIAKNAANIVSKIPTISFVGITGALAMNNANRDSDIDLMIISKRGCLWTTRFLTYLVIWIFGYKVRKPRDSYEKDKLCINLWLDESDLIWDKGDRNIYTAHEIAQIVPIINKYKTHEKFLYTNRWVLNYWPNSVKILKPTKISIIKNKNTTVYFFEKFFYLIQHLYMRSKITREIITPTRAIFHPNNWGKVVLQKLTS